MRGAGEVAVVDAADWLGDRADDGTGESKSVGPGRVDAALDADGIWLARALATGDRDGLGDADAVCVAVAHASKDTCESPTSAQGDGGSTSGVGRVHQNPVTTSVVQGGHTAVTLTCAADDRYGIDRPAAENPTFGWTPKARLTPRPAQPFCAVTRKYK